MTRELERAGIPTVQCCNMIPVANAVGVNRIKESTSIKTPFGNPNVSAEVEYQERESSLRQALEKLTLT